MTLLAHTDTLAISDDWDDIIQAVVILNGNQQISNAYILRKNDLQMLISEEDAKHLIASAKRSDSYREKEGQKQSFIV